MAFQGSLKELPLPDIIQLVSVSGKTGRFTLTRDSERGLIFLKNGQMVHAHVGELSGEEAIYALAIWNSGEFQFTPNEEPVRERAERAKGDRVADVVADDRGVLAVGLEGVGVLPE